MTRAMRRLFLSFAVLVFSTGAGCDEPEKPEPPRGKLVVEPAELDFGAVPVGTSLERIAAVENLGPGEAEVRVVALPPGFEVDPPLFRLFPGEVMDVRVVFRPGAEKSASGTIAFASDRAGRANLEVRAQGRDEALDVPASLDAGSVALGASRVVPLPIENPGGVSLDVRAFVLAGDAFEVDSAPVAVPAGGSAVLEIDFRPSRIGVAPGLLSLRPCPACREQYVSLTGTGVVQRLDFEVEQVDFGIVLASSVAHRDIAVTNQGTAALRLAPPGIEGGEGAFSVEAGAEGEPLGEGETRRFVVRFAPQAPGRYEARLALDDADGVRLAHVDLVGEARTAELELVPAEIDFGAHLPDQMVWQTVRVRPSGEAPTVPILEASIGGASPFSLRAPALPWETDEEAVFEVGFHPTEAGEFEDELRLQLGGGAEPLRISLRGVAVPAPPCDLEADADSILFGLVPLRFEGAQVVGLTNRSDHPCVFWGADVVGKDAALVEVGPAGWVEVPAGGHAEIGVQVATQETQSRELSARVRLRYGAPAAPRLLELPIVMAVSLLLDEPIAPLLFETTPVDRATVREPPPLLLGTLEARLLPGSSPAFDLLPGQTPRVVFRPEEPGRHDGRLALLPVGTSVPLVVDLVGEGGPPCEGCDWPESSCAVPAAAPFDQDLLLADVGVDACHWRVVDPRFAEPVDETVDYALLRMTSTACSATLRFFGPGTWTLRNLRVRADGRAADCEAEVEALAPEGFWFEVVAEDEMAELALVVARGGDPTVRSTWFDASLACSGPSGPGGGCGWPTADADHLPRFAWPSDFAYRRVQGHVAIPETGIAYHLAVHAEPAAAGTVGQVRVRVYCGGAFVGEFSDAFLQGENRLRVHGTVEFVDPATCTLVPDGATEFPYRLMGVP